MGTKIGFDINVDLFKSEKQLSNILKKLIIKVQPKIIRISGSNKELMKKAVSIIPLSIEILILPRALDVKFSKHAELVFNISKVIPNQSNIIFGLGNELTLDTTIIFNQPNYNQRLKSLWHPKNNTKTAKRKINRILNKKILQLVKKTKKKFQTITYCSGSWEEVDWKKLSHISVNRYITPINRHFALNLISKLGVYNKPIIFSEIGCSTFENADYFGSSAHMYYQKIYNKSEKTQAKGINYQLKFIKKEKLYAGIIYTLVENSENKSNTFSLIENISSPKYKLAIECLIASNKNKSKFNYTKKEELKMEEISKKIKKFQKAALNDKNIYSAMIDTKTTGINIFLNDFTISNKLLKNYSKYGKIISVERFLKQPNIHRYVCIYGYPITK